MKNKRKRKKKEMNSMDVSEVLSKNRTVFITGEITQELANVIISQLLCFEAEDSEKGITIYLNSPGGDSEAMHAILDVYSLIKPDITVVNLSCAYSAASLLLAAGDKRYSLPSAQVMIHQVAISTNKQRWTKDEINMLNESINAEQQKYIDCMLKYTKITKDKLEEFLKRDTFLNALECVELGIIDSIL